MNDSRRYAVTRDALRVSFDQAIRRVDRGARWSSMPAMADALSEQTLPYAIALADRLPRTGPALLATQYLVDLMETERADTVPPPAEMAVVAGGE